MSERFTVRLRPLYDLFQGRSSQGQRVSMLRTDERVPVLIDFDFGTIRLKCDDGSTILDSTTSSFSANINRGHISAMLATNGEYETVIGRFTSDSAITGALASRANCGSAPLRWSVRLVARHTLGPISFPLSE